ncbi:3-hydroxybutyryl-CoA dehydrogenase [Sarcoptes scabiei]|nr:3-hydroxybutyryl-CoA dehydrogenase [Sarcoptes scabiei]
MMSKSNRIGYWFNERKSLKLNIESMRKQFASKGFEFVKLDLDTDLEQQGPFDAIIHKLCVQTDSENQDDNAEKQLKSFEEFLEKHPELIVFDRPKNIRKVIDRYRQYKIVENSELAKEDGVFTPTFVEMTSSNGEANLYQMHKANVKFPFVCKPISAQGTQFTHRMSIIFDEKGLESIKGPCVAQTFINHNARLFKLFVIRDQFFVIERPSLKNFKRNHHQETIYFDTHDISKPYSCSSLIELDEDDKDIHIIEPNHERFEKIIKILSKELELYLFGVDVIIDNETGRYAIIDINSFPGYDGVENYCELFCNAIIDEIEKARGNCRNSSLSNKKYCPQKEKKYEIDSGIDTSDSCDEKKYPKKCETPPMKFYKRQHNRWQQQQSLQQSSPLSLTMNSVQSPTTSISTVFLDR